PRPVAVRHGRVRAGRGRARRRLQRLLLPRGGAHPGAGRLDQRRRQRGVGPGEALPRAARRAGGWSPGGRRQAALGLRCDRQVGPREGRRDSLARARTRSRPTPRRSFAPPASGGGGGRASRAWSPFLWASVTIVRAAFGMTWPRTLVGAWLVLRATQVWAPYPNNDPEA